MYTRVSILFIISISLRAYIAAPAIGNEQTEFHLGKPAVEVNLNDKNLQEVDEDVEELHSLVKADTSSSTPTSQLIPDEIVVEDKRDSEFHSEDENSFDLSDSRDTPRDMAEYIFWTGDENSVTSAVKDFIKQGLMEEENALGFLQQVHSYLKQMHQKYGSTKPDRKLHAEMLTNHVKSSSDNDNKPHGQIAVTNLNPLNKIRNDSGQNHLAKLLLSAQKEKKNDFKAQLVDHSTEKSPTDNNTGLEDIIYQLSRILFTQSLHKAKPEESLEKFADFLEKESKDGRLSPQLQKKVLDLLLTSLLDTMIDQHDDTKKQSFTTKLDAEKLTSKKSN